MGGVKLFTMSAILSRKPQSLQPFQVTSSLFLVGIKECSLVYKSLLIIVDCRQHPQDSPQSHYHIFVPSAAALALKLYRNRRLDRFRSCTKVS